MKIKRILPIVFAASVALVGCGTPAAGRSDQGGKQVFPVSTYEDSLTVLMGDVMPFYDDGVMNIYHLQNSRGTLSMFYHPIARLTTTDFVNYTDEGVAIDFEESVTSPDAALGTGSFIKGDDGAYHCFYTGHNPEFAHDWSDPDSPYTEAVRHAVSYDDQRTWQKDDDFVLYGYSDDFRDPYVYYDGDDDMYYMLVTTRDNDCGVIKRYGSDSLDADADGWKDLGVFFRNDSGSFNMECPSYVEYNGYYYLMYSEQGDNRVTHYRYKTDKDEDWKRFERDYVDSTGFYAGRLEKAGDKLYAFAWCAKLTGGSTGDFDWGGNLVVHEIVNKSNGELCAVMGSSVKDAFSNEVSYKRINGETAREFVFSGDGFSSYGMERLSEKVTRIAFKISVDSYAGDFGLSFGLDGDYDNRLGSCVVAFDAAKNNIAVYNDVSNIIRYGSALSSMPFAFDYRKQYDVEIIKDSEVFTVYVDGSIAITGRCSDIVGNNFAFYGNGATASIKEIKFYE